MFEIAVYKAEREAGLTEQIRTTASIAYASELYPSDKQELTETVKAHISKGSSTDFDLHYLKSILVSTGKNKNDDVFLPLEVWCARRTPEDKPFNYEHNCADIIGHIIDSYAVDKQGSVIAADTAPEDLPAQFDVYTPSVLYKYWDKAELQERMDSILREIAENKWFVSMEALFKNFDYELRSTAGVEIVSRNEQTAFLTKHLRIYGGSGEFDGKKVGRVLRQITFSGKGLVRKPANPDSLILTKSSINSETVKDLGYLSTEGTITETVMNEQEKIIAELREEIKTLQTSLRENDVKQVKAQLDAVIAEKTKVDETVKTLQSSIAELTTKLADTNKLLDTAKSELAETQKTGKAAADELAALKAEARKQTRLSTIKTELKVDDATAADLFSNLETFSDEQFTKHIAALAKLAPTKTEEKPNQAEADAKAAEAAAKALETTKATEEPALSVDTSDKFFEKVQADINAFFKVEKE